MRRRRANSLKLSGTLNENEFNPNFITDREAIGGALSFHTRNEFLLNLNVNRFVNGRGNELSGIKSFHRFQPGLNVIQKWPNLPSRDPWRLSRTGSAEF